jgi:CheY-like chemotaxis protein
VSINAVYEPAVPGNRDYPLQAVALVIDDEPIMGRFVTHALQKLGITVVVASTGGGGIATARGTSVDVILLDIKLPDMSGIEVARMLRREMPHVRLIIVSAVLSIESAVEAMKIGVCDVIQKPLTGERVREVVRLALTSSPRVEPARQSAGRDSGISTVSISERWARVAYKGCLVDRDLKTLGDWARVAGVSYSSLCEVCRLVGMKPHEARDLVRVLRAIVRAAQQHCPFHVLLDVGDRRTLDHLVDRSRLDAAGTHLPSIPDFLAKQRFVSPDSEAIRLLSDLLASRKLA